MAVLHHNGVYCANLRLRARVDTDVQPRGDLPKTDLHARVLHKSLAVLYSTLANNSLGG